jgi:creatinine amidohydrolase
MLFSNLTYGTINREVNDKVIVLPIAAIEQHGPHLCVSTDTDIVTAVATAVEALLPDDVLLCPTLPFGSSHHHLSFGGTLSVSINTYTQLIVELVESMLQNGFRRIVLLNGHGGNITPVKQALAVLGNKYDSSISPNIALVTYWETAGNVFAGEAPMESPALSHACEYETSMMLHLYPGKVWMNLAERAKRPESNGFIPFEDDEAYRGVTLFKQTAFISSNGSSGEPQLGTAEKGKHLFDSAVKSVSEFLKSFKTWPFLPDLKHE